MENEGGEPKLASLDEVWSNVHEKRLWDDPAALDAVYPAMPLSRKADTDLTDLEVFTIFRDYIKHEDGLLSSRLSSFLAMNTFLIGASALVLGGMLQLLAKESIFSVRTITIVSFAAFLHSVIAVIGLISAMLTATSIHAATDALAILRDKGNSRLRNAIRRGDIPFLTNARGLTAKERGKLDRGTGIMRWIPSIMQIMWVILGLIPLAVIALVYLANRGVVEWPSAVPPS